MIALIFLAVNLLAALFKSKSIVAFFLDASDFVRSWRRWVRRDWSRLNLRMRVRTPAFRASNKRRSTSHQYTDDLLIKGPGK